MSSCGIFYIGKCDIFETKRMLNPKLLSLFRYPYVNKKDTKFTQTIAELKQRLNLIGFTYSAAEKIFNTYKEEWLSEFINNNENSCNKDSLFLDIDVGKISGELGNIIMKNECLFINEQIKNQLIYDFIEECFEGFEGNKIDIRWLVRIAIDQLNDKISITYKFGDLIDAGYYNTKNIQDIYNIIIKDNQNIFTISDKIIILTEGKTDAEFIQDTMQLLYPHLTDYYAFLDFSNGYEGSAKTLFNNIKSFIAAGINTKIIGIFDNDSSGCGFLEGLQKYTRIPKNIKLLNYPNLELADNYPTKEITSEDIKLCDINGLACSIELYFGENILQDENGNLIPIQWEKTNKAINRQGSIRFKNKIQEKIQAKIRNAKGKSQLNKSEWKDFDCLLKMIFNAFHKTIDCTR